MTVRSFGGRSRPDATMAAAVGGETLGRRQGRGAGCCRRQAPGARRRAVTTEGRPCPAAEGDAGARRGTIRSARRAGLAARRCDAGEPQQGVSRVASVETTQRGVGGRAAATLMIGRSRVGTSPCRVMVKTRPEGQRPGRESSTECPNIRAVLRANSRQPNVAVRLERADPALGARARALHVDLDEITRRTHRESDVSVLLSRGRGARSPIIVRPDEVPPTLSRA